MKHLKTYNIFPEQITHEFNYLKIDNRYICTYAIVGFSNEITFISTIDLLYKYKNMKISVDVRKINGGEYIKKLSNLYFASKTEKSASKYNIDKEVLNDFEKSILDIREAVQVKNEDVYSITIYLTFISAAYEELISYSKYVQNMLYSQGIIIKPLNFRQLDGYLLSSFPCNSRNRYFQKYLSNILTTSGFATLFPYINSNIIDAKGIIFGKVSNSICVLDMFSPKYNNRNMCIFGSSGAGKSYFIKSILVRHMCLGVNQIVIDPEGEYAKLVATLGGQVVKANSINILAFTESFYIKCKSQGTDVITEKSRRIYSLLSKNDATVEKYNKFYNILKKLYKDFGIDSESVYKSSENDDEIIINKTFIKCTQFPKVTDLISVLSKHKDLKNILFELQKLEKHSSIEKEDLWNFNMSVIDFSGLSNLDLEVFLPICIERIEEDMHKKTLVYIDEIWKVLQRGKDYNVTNKIIEMYKTIRKKGAGIIGITQDVTDMALYGNGELGKGILSNSYFKLFFRMDYMALEELKKMGLVNELILQKVRVLERGKAIMCMGGNIFNLEVFTSEYEHNLIMEE